MKPRFVVDQFDRWVQIASEKHYTQKVKNVLDKIAGEEGFLDYPAMKEYYRKQKERTCKTKNCKSIVMHNNKTGTCYSCRIKTEKKVMQKKEQKKHGKL